MSNRLDEYLTLLEQSGLDGTSLCRAVDAARDRPEADAAGVAAELQSRGHVTKWQNKQLLAGRNIRLGKYLLLEILGAGSMGVVFLAEHVMMRRRVAIKVLPAALSQDAHRLGRFLSEARAVAALDHPHIVRAFSVDNQGAVYYLAMEYVAGRSLAQRVESDGALAPHQAAEYVRQVALGLSHAHGCGIVHRDIKPANLLVGDDGQVKILDLGLALTKLSDNGLTTEQLLGTADYLSPEQALDSHAVDARTDLYSLGCTLHYLMTGGPPFPSETLAAAIINHQTQDPPDINALRAEQGLESVPGELPAICAKLMAKDPDDRYTSAAETAEVLAQWLTEHPPREVGSPGPGGGFTRVRRPESLLAGVPRTTLVAGSAVVLSAVAAITWLLWPEPPQTAPAPMKRPPLAAKPAARDAQAVGGQATTAPKAATATARFIGMDAETRGDWVDKYGKQGCDIMSDAGRPASFAALSYSGHTPFIWGGASDERALKRLASPEKRISGCLFSYKPIELDLYVTDQDPHRVSLYLLDWDRVGRVQRVEVVDAGTQTVLDTRTARDFAGGQYFTWETRGHVVFRITHQGPGNAVVSGVFFD